MLTAVESPVRILVVAAQPLAPGSWRVTFRVTNLLADTLLVEDAWLPHGRFRGTGHTPLGVTVPAAEDVAVTLAVNSDEPAGTVVKNAFLILRIFDDSGERGWRVFTRMRIEFDGDGMHPMIESITAHTLNDDAAVT
jgi:hypothetical protein